MCPMTDLRILAVIRHSIPGISCKTRCMHTEIDQVATLKTIDDLSAKVIIYHLLPIVCKGKVEIKWRMRVAYNSDWDTLYVYDAFQFVPAPLWVWCWCGEKMYFSDGLYICRTCPRTKQYDPFAYYLI